MDKNFKYSIDKSVEYPVQEDKWLIWNEEEPQPTETYDDPNDEPNDDKPNDDESSDEEKKTKTKKTKIKKTKTSKVKTTKTKKPKNH